MSINVHIDGNKSYFKSKTAVNRFKRDLKKTDITLHLEPSKYFLEKCDYQLVVQDNNYNVKLVKKENNVKKDALRKKLKQKISSLKDNRRNVVGKKLDAMKKEVPKSLFNSYLRLKKLMPNSPVESPDEILNNRGKYIDTFKSIAENMSLNELKSNDPYKSYLIKLIRELGLEESFGTRKKKVPEIPEDLKFEVIDKFKESEYNKSDFIESDKFDGAKEGYVFKKDIYGLGYYPD